MEAFHTANSEERSVSNGLNARMEQDNEIISCQDARVRGVEAKIETSLVNWLTLPFS